MNSVLQPLGIPQKSQPLPPPREEAETGIDFVAQHREADEAAQMLVQLNTTLSDEVQPPTGYVITSSQTGVKENDVSDNAIPYVSRRSSTPFDRVSTDISLDLLQ